MVTTCRLRSSSRQIARSTRTASPATDAALLLAIVVIAALAVLLLRIGDLASLSVGKEGVAAIEVAAIGAIPKHGANLSDWVKVTEQGKRFVELRAAPFQSTYHPSASGSFNSC